MFGQYQPLAGESVYAHINRVRHATNNSGIVERVSRLRIPIITETEDGMVLLRDMTVADNPSTNACLSLPFAREDTITKKFKYGVKIGYFVRKCLVKTGPERVPGTIEPFGFYKVYTSDHGRTAIDITSLPAVVSLTPSASDLRPINNLSSIRGQNIWFPFGDALEELRMQADSLPENNLAYESLVLVNERIKQQGEVNGAHS